MLVEPIVGTQDRYGAALRKWAALSDLASSVALRNGYEELKVPLLEHVSSFAEEVVGESPWPEWNKKGVFYLDLPRYGAGYEDESAPDAALLIPEGTVSVSRWLAKQIAADRTSLPIKVFYELPCFRNEPVESLNRGKRREFSQFGLEILGASNAAADVEIVLLLNRILAAIGIAPGHVRVRMNDVGIFAGLVAESSLSHRTAIELKEQLDTIAECRAGKKPERLDGALATARSLLSSHGVTGDIGEAWEQVLSPSPGTTAHLQAALFRREPFLSRLTALETLRRALAGEGMLIHVDPCVVRSHEYYTGPSFEVDVIGDSGNLVEIAGGGRYDKLVGHFLGDAGPDAVPATGFAFGMERLFQVAEAYGCFSKPITRRSTHRFDESAADLLLVPNLSGERARGYLDADRIVGTLDADRISIYTGDSRNPADIQMYAQEHSIPRIQWSD